MSKMTRDNYIKIREMWRLKGEQALKINDTNEADYCVGVIRGLDLAFGEGSAEIK